MWGDAARGAWDDNSGVSWGGDKIGTGSGSGWGQDTAFGGGGWGQEVELLYRQQMEAKKMVGRLQFYFSK